MVSSRQERAVVAEMYEGRGWKKKVDNMSDGQVHAIYMKHMGQQDNTNNKKEK